MKRSLYHVDANWDPDAEVWVATSEDVPGLATEADSIESLTKKLRVMIPELLEANQLLRGNDSATIAFELISHRQERLRLAS
jgi:predicted RNase H-like HicB family nuclease